MDCVTLSEAVAICEGIREAFLIPIPEQLLHNLSFKMLGFHPVSGPEFVNCHLADLLNKWLTEKQTKPAQCMATTPYRVNQGMASPCEKMSDIAIFRNTSSAQ